MVSLTDSSDNNYQTPPEEHHSISQNSGKTNIFVDDENAVDLDNDTEILDEMHEREREASKSDVAVLDRGKRKLPVSLDKKVTENSRGGECSKHDVLFKDTINSVFKMLVAEGKGKGRGEGKGVDFLDTAKKKGMTFPRPRWRTAETWKGL